MSGSFECMIPGCRNATDGAVCHPCRDEATVAAVRPAQRVQHVPGHADTREMANAPDGPYSRPGNSKRNGQ
jgi:hypothetical protein